MTFRFSALILAAALMASGCAMQAEAPVEGAPQVSASTSGQATPRLGFSARRAAAKAEAEAEAQRQDVKQAVAKAAEIAPSRGRIWCVPFARDVAGVSLRGNAGTWWAKAKGLYARGNDPQIGAVMSFASSRAMPMGHVGIVSGIVDSRTILVDHANWVRNKITLDQMAIDVSAANDWSAVKIVNADGSTGRVNPVHGFIYN